jgi:hypothetical protein
MIAGKTAVLAQGSYEELSRKEVKYKQMVQLFLDKVRLNQLPGNIRPFKKENFASLHLPKTNVDISIRSGYMEIWIQKKGNQFYWKDDGPDGVCDKFSISHGPLFKSSYTRPTPKDINGWQPGYRKIFRMIMKEIRTGKHGLFSGVRCFLLQFFVGSVMMTPCAFRSLAIFEFENQCVV